VRCCRPHPGSADGLAAIAEDDNTPPDALRFVARRVRAECRTLPPIAEVRERGIPEKRARQRLEVALSRYSSEWARQRDASKRVAERIEARAAAAGHPLPVVAVLAGFSRMAACGTWLHQRLRSAPRDRNHLAEHLIEEIDRGGPLAARCAEMLAAEAAVDRGDLDRAEALQAALCADMGIALTQD